MLTFQRNRHIMKPTSERLKFGGGELKLAMEDEVKKYLDEKGISQTFVSRRTGIPLPKLNMALNGHRKMTFPEYELVCGALEVNTDKFLKPRLPDETKNC